MGEEKGKQGAIPIPSESEKKGGLRGRCMGNDASCVVRGR